MQIQETTGGGAYALIVGISHYRDEKIRPLAYTHADAEAFAALLTDPNRCGLPRDNVRILLDEDATLFNIKNGISGWLYQHASPDCTVFVFFAGHGGVESDRTGLEPDGTAKYLLPWDASVDNLFASALSNMEFHHLLNTIKARRLVIFMDACYAGGVAERGARDLAIVANPYERLAEGEGRIVIAASRPNQRSWEDDTLGHGIFTHHLLEALSGGADSDEDGCVSIMDVYRHLERQVPRSARRLSRSDQEPLLFGNIASDIVLAVDRERIRQTRRRVEEEARRQSEEGRRRRARLFELYDDGRLSIELYRECLQLLDSDPAEIDSRQRTLLEYLSAMLDDRIELPLFVQTWMMLHRDPAEVAPGQVEGQASAHRSSGGGPSDAAPTGQPGKVAAPRFCHGCGRQLVEGKRFCMHCGRALDAPRAR
jgi:uncharacterized caspase-like protein